MIERPSHAKPHPRDSERTRARILQAAIELFSSGSYDMVRSRDIADKAGIDVALINRYFGSKKALFSAALDVIAKPRVITKQSAKAKIILVIFFIKFLFS